MRSSRKITLSQRLIVQGSDSVMIPAGEIPIIIIESRGDDIKFWTPELARAVNFIRCGCPEVVLWSGYIEDMMRQWVYSEDKILAFLKELNKRLDVLSGSPVQFMPDYRGDGVFVVYPIGQERDRK